MIPRLVGLTAQFFGLALVFAALSFGATGRGLAAGLSALGGIVCALVGSRLLGAAA